jgi:hypothetical protein
MYAIHAAVAVVELQLLQLDIALVRCVTFILPCAVSGAELRNFGWLSEKSMELTL